MLRKLTVTLLLIILNGSFAACYTLFKHPRLAKLNYRRPDDNRCVACHSHADLRRLVSPEKLRRTNAAWDGFYDDPWWFDERHGELTDSTKARKTQEHTPDAPPHTPPAPSSARESRVDGENSLQQQPAR